MAASILKTVGSLAATAARVAVRRISKGRKHPHWSFTYELLTEFLQGHMAEAAKIADAAKQRRFVDAAVPPSPYLARVITSDDHLGGVPTKVYLPRKEPVMRTFLFLHGGGYVLHAKTHAGFAASIGLAMKAKTFVPEYRLAPEHPYPAAVEDALAAYKALLDSGVDPKRLIVGGDSAGGGLTVALLCKLREKKLPMPAMALLISPWVDVSNSGESMESNRPYDWLLQEQARQWSTWYLNGVDAKDPVASPLYADLKGLPPLYIQAGDGELLIDQIRDFTVRARTTGVDASLDTWPGMGHEHQVFATLIPEGREALEKIGEVVEKRLP